jgi:hypothetical protein
LQPFGSHDCRHILIVKNVCTVVATLLKPMHRTIDRRQPCAAVSAVLNVLLGRITAVVLSLSAA